MGALLDDVLETWEINNEINLFILRWIPPEGLESPDAESLSRAIRRSGEGVTSVVRSVVEEGGAIKGWKRSPVAWLTYLISHDSRHRGQIAQALKQSGVRPPQEVSYGIWGYWGGYELKEPAGP